METFYMILIIIACMLFGYLFGSIENGVLIGKIFFHKDITKEGSGNTGGTNAGRILGKRIGLIVIILDVLKSFVPMWITYFILSYTVLKNYAYMPCTYYLTGIGAVIGHTYPIFNHFKGGKAVSTFGGFVLGTNWMLAIFGVSMFMIILLIKKYVSLASIIGSLLTAAASFIPFAKYGMNLHMEWNLWLSFFYLGIAIYVIYRHRSNIKRLLSHSERKVTWIK